MNHFGIEWWWQLWCGLMTVLWINYSAGQMALALHDWMHNRAAWYVAYLKLDVLRRTEPQVMSSVWRTTYPNSPAQVSSFVLTPK